MAKYKVVHYINQFFAGIGGEEKADYTPELREGVVGPGMGLKAALGEDYEIVSYAENMKKGKATLVIQGRRQYGGTKKVTFTIKPRNMNENFKDAAQKMMSVLMEQIQ